MNERSSARATIHFLGRRSLSANGPAKARPVPLDARMDAEQAFHVLLSDCLTQITANAALLRAGRSTEGLHQLRVGLRRLEVALDAFAREFRTEWLTELRGRAKILSSRLGPARDLDVFIEERLDHAVPAEDRPLLAPLKARAQGARDKAWDEAGACIVSGDFSLFLDDIAQLATARLGAPRHGALPRVAARILRRQEKRAVRRAAKARSRDEGDLHRLRIAVKKLRYTAEFFAPLYPAKKVRRYLRHVRRMQEQMGEVNDIAHLRLTLASLLRDGPQQDDGDVQFAAGMVLGGSRYRGPRIAKKALKRWDRFGRIAPFWD